MAMNPERCSTPLRGDGRTIFPVSALVVAVCSLLVLAPGGMSQDSVNQLVQARSGVYSDDHPPFMAVLWRQMDFLVPGPLGMLVLHLAMICAALYMLLRTIQTPAIIALIGFATVLCWPGYFFVLGVIWKDVAMLAALLLALALIERNRAGERSWRSWLAIPTAVLLVYGVGVRHNAAAAAFPIMTYWAWLAFGRVAGRKRRAFLGLGTGVLATVTAFGAAQLVSQSLVTTRASYWQVLAMYDIVAVSVGTGIDHVPPEVYPRATMEEMRTLYTPRSLVPLTQESRSFPFLHDPSKLAALRRAWLAAVGRHPGVYLWHRWKILRHVLGLVPDEPWVAVFREGVVQNALGVQNVAGYWSRVSRDSLAEVAASGSVLFRPWLYLVASMCIAIVAVVTRHRLAALIVMLAVSSVTSSVGLMFTTGAPDYRYSIWSLFVAVLGVVLYGAALWVPNAAKGGVGARVRQPTFR